MTEEQYNRASEIMLSINRIQNQIQLIENDRLSDIRLNSVSWCIPELRSVTLNLLKQKLVEYQKKLEEL